MKMCLPLLFFLTLGGLSLAAIDETCLCVQGFCDPGWVQYKNACYKRFKESVLWTEAEVRCLSHDSHLASIHSFEENNFVYNLMGKPNSPMTGEAYWIGLHDLLVEGNYMYTDGSKLTFNQFGEGQPDNSGHEHVVASQYYSNGHIKWNDYLQPKYTFPFICKYYLGNRLCMNDEAPYGR